MAKIPFDIKYRPQIESGEYKVVTDVGEPVEIVKWDCKGKCPILAVIDDGDTHDSCFYHTDGSSYSGKEHIYVLTPELTKFEEEILSAIVDYEFNKDSGFTDSDSARKHAIRIMNAAKEEIKKEYLLLRPGQLEITSADKAYQDGYEEGLKSESKHLPRWKKVKDGRCYDQGFTIDEYDNGRKVLCLYNHEIDLEELYAVLPKEE